MKNVKSRLLPVAGTIVAGVVAAVAFGGWGGTTTTSAPLITTVSITVPGPPGPPGPPGLPGSTGATGPAGVDGKSADLCPNWDGVQQKPPPFKVGTLNPRGQFVCVALWRAKAWHTK